MRRIFLLIILLALTVYGYGPEEEHLLSLNKDVANLDFLSSIEKKVIAELNRARTNPARYARYLEDFKRFYVGKYIKIAGRTSIVTQEGAPAVTEAIEFLKKTTPLPPLAVSRGLSAAAKAHVEDQGPTGLLSHTGSDNSSPLDRILRFGEPEGAWGENIDYGEDSARRVVMQLIIDDGIPDRGHRGKIFQADFGVVGVGFGVHRSYGTMCVMDFAASYTEKEED
ncbi:MAG: CAP domain-containing protein [bacterium]|nr:CAP domain-containing protein [bacterium]